DPVSLRAKGQFAPVAALAQSVAASLRALDSARESPPLRMRTPWAVVRRRSDRRDRAADYRRAAAMARARPLSRRRGRPAAREHPQAMSSGPAEGPAAPA